MPGTLTDCSWHTVIIENCELPAMKLLLTLKNLHRHQADGGKTCQTSLSTQCPDILAIASKAQIHNNPHRISTTTTGSKLIMNRKELIDALAAKTGSTKADADRNIAALIDIITATLKKGDNIALIGFGTFEVRKRAARNGRNPSTGAAIKIKASKAPAFKAGATLKAAVNGGKK